ncbi:hypothetical protein GOP47_0002647 [Adiantum capillus-veneris]|uniref:Tafazzin family protein n=1 Tax=Adiantum capillus-veneris TaxID=13818 RepID=A0A9D4VAR4_ADICA|nr:hypothetical protein GOP47_0002647 [Adiantum capillus-veneris]
MAKARETGAGAMVISRTLPWAAKSSHLGEFPRRLVLKSGSALCKLITSFLNTSHVYNLDTLNRLVHSRPPGTPLITVSNHMTTLDDPLMWGMKGFSADAKLARWTLAADDICFTNPILSYFFRLGKCIPITRGAGIYQPHMYEALERLNEGDWLHTFPEGKISQENGPIRRLKWGVASLIERALVPPIVLPICHSGFEKVMPENYLFGRRPLLPLWSKNISIVVGEPIQFDLRSLRQTAEEAVRRVYSTQHDESPPLPELPCKSALGGLPEDRVVQWLYSHMSDHIRIVMQELVIKAKALNNKMDSHI